jgi:hypothetical protein
MINVIKKGNIFSVKQNSIFDFDFQDILLLYCEGNELSKKTQFLTSSLRHSRLTERQKRERLELVTTTFDR